MTSELLAALGLATASALVAALYAWARAGRSFAARAFVAGPRASGPEVVLTFLPGVSLVLAGVAVGKLGVAFGGRAEAVSGVLCLIVSVIGLTLAIGATFFGWVPSILRPSWFEPKEPT